MTEHPLSPEILDQQVGGDHYRDMAIQPLDFIVQNRLDFVQGNIIKYVVRYKKKGGLEDIDKALHYLLALRSEYVATHAPDVSPSAVASYFVRGRELEQVPDDVQELAVRILFRGEYPGITQEEMTKASAEWDCAAPLKRYRATMLASQLLERYRVFEREHYTPSPDEVCDEIARQYRDI